MKARILVSAIFAASSLWAAAVSQVNPAVDEIAPYVYPDNSYDRPTLTFMPDGQRYAEMTDGGRKIVVTDISTGATEVLFDVAHTRETTLLSIEGFTLSPDASKILVWTGSKHIYRRTFTAEYYVYEVRSRLLKPLSKQFPRQQAPVFSPNSRMTAFVADNNVYVAKLDYGTEVAVTTDGEKGRIINGVPDWTYEEEFDTTVSMAWAPDNLTLCWIRYNETDVPVYSFPLYQGTCNPNNDYEFYPGTFSYKYPVAGMPNSKVSIHSYDIETRKIKDLPLPDANIEYIPGIHYGPTADMLMVVTLNRDQNHMEIYGINPKSTVVKSLMVENSKAWVTPETYENIHYGADCFTVMSSRSGWCQLYQYSYAGAELRCLTSGDADVTDYYGADEAGNHYYQVAAPTPMERTVRRIDRKGVVTDVAYSEGTTSATLAPGMKYMLINHSDVATPPVYTLRNSAGKTVKTLIDNAGYAARYTDLPRKEFFTMQSDGYTLNGWMIKPANFDASRRYPVIMYQYSGPDSQQVLNTWQMDWYYYFAQNGYVVICVDGRGTGGRGRAFAEVVYKQLGHYETIDQIAAARYAASLPFVDSKRIGLFGWSYGGYETLMASSASDAPYAAACAVAPVTSWRYYDTVYTERYMLTPQQNYDGYRQSAPLTHSASLQCPLLIMSGTADDNVHMLNTLQYVSKLQSESITCDMLLFPNMNHSINFCNARAVVYARMLEFFNNRM